MIRIAPLLFVMFAYAPAVCAQGITATLPEDVDPAARYVFYLADEMVTPANPEPRHPEYGTYQYLQIANQLLAAGFSVVSRPRETNEHPYLVAEEVADQVQRLLDAGVPAPHIGIMGAGKGAAITVLAASRLSHPGLQVVVLSLCNDAFMDFWIANKELLSGNVLSVYAEGTPDRTSCRRYLEHCAGVNVRMHREIALPASAGPAFHFRASGDWLLPAIEWLRGNHDRVSEQGILPPDVRKPE